MHRIVLAGLLLAVPAGRAVAQDRDDFRWAKSLAAGKTLEIVGVNGDIDAQGGSGGEARVTAVKRGRRSDPDEVRIEVVEHEDGVTICAVYPDQRNRERNACRAEGKSHNEVRDNDVKVTFHVTVPRGVRLVARTVNGQVDAIGLSGEVEGHSVNGSVTIETAGYGSATTVNGSIHAKLGRADWSDELEFSTVNGEIDLTLPESVNAEVEARSVNGGIESDFPLSVRGRFGPKHLRGTIGTGGRGLSLSTVNGGMELRRGG